MSPPRRVRQLRMPDPPALPLPAELLFCAICQVSISVGEIDSGEARRTPRGRTFCAVCATATPEERSRRREALAIEFADDAPVPVPAPIPWPGAVAPPALERPATAEVPPPLTRGAEESILDLRVGELERAAFRLQSRVATLEERLEAVLRRMG